MRVAIDDTELYFDVEGAALVPDGETMRERPILVALHGGPGFDHAYLKPALSPLSETAQVIYLDLRGHGRSARPPVETCTLEQMADDVATFCGVLGIDRPNVLGHSFGGFVALHLALRHPDLVGRLILMDTAASWDDTDSLEIIGRRLGAEVRAAVERRDRGEVTGADARLFAERVFPEYVFPSGRNLELVSSATRRIIPNSDMGRFWSESLAQRYDLVDRLAEIRAPTLVIVGDYDWRTPPSQSRRIEAGIPGAELLVVDDCGHFGLYEQPEVVLGAIREWISPPEQAATAPG